MFEIDRVIVTVAVVLAAFVLTASAAIADGIDPGLWKITGHIEFAGVIGPRRIVQMFDGRADQ